MTFPMPTIPVDLLTAGKKTFRFQPTNGTIDSNNSGAAAALPSALPLIFTGLRLSLGVGWMVLIAAEMLAQNPGLGKFVWDEFQNGSSQSLARIMVAVLTIGLIGFALDRITGIINALVEFCEGDDGKSKACRCQFLKASRHALDVVQVVNDPIGIDQVGHSLGSGRVLISRSA